MTIRTYQPGDEAAQVEIYNEAAGQLPKFKPAAVDEVVRRVRAADFDPKTRFYALEDGKIVGYATFQTNGRVSYPWCRAGAEEHAPALFDAVMEAMRQRGLPRAFAAYRADWPEQAAFLNKQGFQKVRDMINYVVELWDLPTPGTQANLNVTTLREADIPAVLALAPEVLRVSTAADLEKWLLQNPYFDADALYCLRSRAEGKSLLGVGILVEKPNYADARKVDPEMPCFRLGAFGTEGMTTKRINGLFSFLTPRDRDVTALALDLLGYAAYRLRNANIGTLAAQVPSDAPHLVRFYQQYFHRQGTFPVFEKSLSD